MKKLRALDLFCKSGGATKGLQNAGFEVHGVDIEPQSNYCGEQFTQADATTFSSIEWLVQFDLIWASPPCQAHTSLKVMHNARKHPDLIPSTRNLLLASGRPFIIENVVGAPLMNPVQLCGTMFGLGVQVYDGWRQLRRHRLFETSFLAPPSWCDHSGATIGLYGDHARDRRRKPGVRDHGIDFPDCDTLQLGIDSMQMPWCRNWKEISQAIPPVYAQYLAEWWKDRFAS